MLKNSRNNEMFFLFRMYKKWEVSCLFLENCSMKIYLIQVIRVRSVYVGKLLGVLKTCVGLFICIKKKKYIYNICY